MEELILQMNNGQIENNLDSYELAITETLKKYNYVVDETTYAQAKEDRAKLNKNLEKCKRERIDFEASLNSSWSPIKTRLMDTEKLINGAISRLGASIDDFDLKAKNGKKAEIETVYSQCEVSKLVPLEKIFVDSWLNKSVTTKKWKEELDEKVNKIKQDMEMIKCFQPEDKGDALQVQKYYLETLDIGKTKIKADQLIENRKKAQEMEQRRLELEQQRANEQAQHIISHEGREHVQQEDLDQTQEMNQESLLIRSFQVQATRNQIIELGNYMKLHGIKFRKLEVK